MVGVQTKFRICDNTGVLQIMCINTLKKSQLIIGDKIVAVVKKCIPNMEIKEGAIVYAIIVRTKKNLKRRDNTYISFSENAAIIVNKDNIPLGTRVFGPIPIEIKNKKLQAISNIVETFV